jgi:hypothetical protein
LRKPVRKTQKKKAHFLVFWGNFREHNYYDGSGSLKKKRKRTEKDEKRK